MTSGSRSAQDEPVPAPPVARGHCWVTAPRPIPQPGLILMWELRVAGWFALVVYLVEPDGALVQQWLPAEMIRPVA